MLVSVSLISIANEQDWRCPWRVDKPPSRCITPLEGWSQNLLSKLIIPLLQELLAELAGLVADDTAQCRLDEVAAPFVLVLPDVPEGTLKLQIQREGNLVVLEENLSLLGNSAAMRLAVLGASLLEAVQLSLSFEDAHLELLLDFSVGNMSQLPHGTGTLKGEKESIRVLLSKDYYYNPIHIISSAV